jgi:hypothetical protein
MRTHAHARTHRHTHARAHTHTRAPVLYPWCGSFVRTFVDKLPPFGEAMATIEMARAEANKRARGVRHPQLCLDAIQAGVEHGGNVGLAKEGQAFAAAASLDVHKALVHIFFGQRSTKKIKGITDAGRPRGWGQWLFWDTWA